MHLCNLAMNDSKPVGLPDHAAKSISTSIITPNKPSVFCTISFCTTIYIYTVGIVCYSFKIALHSIIRSIPCTFFRSFTKSCNTISFFCFLDSLLTICPCLLFVYFLRIVIKFFLICRIIRVHIKQFCIQGFVFM